MAVCGNDYLGGTVEKRYCHTSHADNLEVLRTRAGWRTGTALERLTKTGTVESVGIFSSKHHVFF